MLRSFGLALAAFAIGVAYAAEPINVQLTPQNNSGESGTAVLTDAGPKTKVVVEINGAPAGVGQPAARPQGDVRAAQSPAGVRAHDPDRWQVGDDDRRADRRPAEGLRDQRPQVGPGSQRLRLLREHSGPVARQCIGGPISGPPVPRKESPEWLAGGRPREPAQATSPRRQGPSNPGISRRSDRRTSPSGAMSKPPTSLPRSTTAATTASVAAGATWSPASRSSSSAPLTI